jgi:hypothetical protein
VVTERESRHVVQGLTDDEYVEVIGLASIQGQASSRLPLDVERLLRQIRDQLRCLDRI